MILKLAKAARSYAAGQLVTDMPAEASASVRLIHSQRFREWRKDGTAVAPVSVPAPFRSRPKVAEIPADPVKPSPSPKVSASTARAEGAEARKRGLPAASNPYRPRTAASNAWRRGWDGKPAPKSRGGS